MIKKLSILVLVLFSVQIVAQKTNSSPYSVLGVGDAVASKTVEEMSMGGVGTASHSNELSFSNPASYAALTLTTYTLAGENRAYSFEDNNGKATVSNAYLSYLGIGIPLGEKGGFAFGLQLNSTVGYEINEEIFDGTGQSIEGSRYEGNGGTNRVFLGAGYKIFKGLSFGFEGEYIFGKTENSILKQIRDVQLSTRYHTNATVNGFALKGGLLYNKQIKDRIYLNLGAAIGFENELDSKGNDYLYSVSLDGGVEIPRDTIIDIESRGTFKTPLKTSLGASIGDPNKWTVNVDYSFRNAIELTGNLAVHNPKLEYQGASKFSVGGFYIPDYNSISKYWSRVVYRGGIRFEKTGLMVDGSGNATDFTPIDDFGISFGVGLPIGNQLSKLNVGLELGKRGTMDSGLVEEKYFNFRLGFMFTDKWFKKRQIN